MGRGKGVLTTKQDIPATSWAPHTNCQVLCPWTSHSEQIEECENKVTLRSVDENIESHP